MLVGVPVCVWLVSRTTGDLLTGRLQSSTKTDFEQAMNQIEAMRGSGSGSHGVWDGVDRLGSAGMDRLGGTL